MGGIIMNIFDQILASGYYVFGNHLSSHLVRHFIAIERMRGKKFSHDELKMQEIDKYIEFKNLNYVLKNDCNLDDISRFINWLMVAEYHNLKKSWDLYYERKNNRIEPNFKNAMKNIERQEYFIEVPVKVKRKKYES